MSIKDILKKQQDFFDSNTTKDVHYRIQELKKLKDVLKQNEEKLCKAIYKDFRKSAHDTYMTELSQIYHELNVFISKIRKFSKKKRVRTNIANLPARSYIIPEPLGCTLVIGAWNYPYYLSLVPAISALAAGNTVILKPSELPENTSSVLADIINSNFPPEYFCVIEGGVPVTTELLENKFDKIFFTGSTSVGRIVYQAAAKHLTPVTLELGGKSPAFVLKGCNLKIAAKRIAWAKFINAGQTCIAPDYVLVEETIEKEFLQVLKNELEKTYPESSRIGENYTQIINEHNFTRLEQVIEENKVYFGAKTDMKNRFIGPTIMQNVSFNDKVMEEEIFGPILPVINFTDIDEAIRKVKERPKPLSCYVYSNNNKLIKKILKEISFGGGAVNDSLMQISNTKLPFGGVGNSGFGNYHGKAGFDTFSHHKSILHKKWWMEFPLKYFPYKKWKMKVLRMILE